MRLLLTTRFALIAVALLAAARPADAGTLTVMWDPNPDPAVAGYIVYVGTQSGVYTQTHDAGNASWFVLRDAVPGQRYFLAVASYAVGPLVGPKSAEVSGYSNAPPTLAQPSNQQSVIGVPVTLQLQGSDPYGEPVSYGARGLPPGLALTPSTGFIQGAGTTAGTYQVTAWVTDGVLQEQRAFTWAMSDPAGPDPPSSSEPPASDGPPATGAPPPAPDTTAPVVAITVPSSAGSFASSLMTLTLAGTASDDAGVISVSWANSRGGSGVAAGTAHWTIAGLPLQIGANVITITARDAAGNQGTASVTVTYVDSDAPVVQLTSPGTASVVMTYDETILLAGTASDNIGVTRVSWTTDSGLSGMARGTATWSVGPLALEPGTMRVFVSAEDAAGNRGSLLVTVTRLVPVQAGDAVAISPDGEAYETTDPMGRTVTGTTVITHSEPGQGEAAGVEGDAWQQSPPADSSSEPASPGTATLRVAMSREASGGTTTGTVTTFSRMPRTAEVAPGGSTTTTVSQSTMTTSSLALVDPALLLQPVAAPGTDETPLADVDRLGDRHAPKVIVTGPTDSGTYETTEARLFVVGISVDDVGVTAVTWTSSRGQAGTAEGTSVWSFEVSLEPGENVITVMARDAAGHVGRAVLTLQRR